jgi:hypothetical protein
MSPPAKGDVASARGGRGAKNDGGDPNAASTQSKRGGVKKEVPLGLVRARARTPH